MQRMTREQMAARVAAAVPDGSCVNLGIGRPTLVANALPKDREVILHPENGLPGMACVSRVYTDLAVIDVTADGFAAAEIVPGLAFEELAALTGAPLRDGRTRVAAR